MNIHKFIISDLISIGVSEDINIDKINIARLKKYDWINRSGLDTWKAVTDTLETKEIEFLAKGIVLAENEFRWIGGSVAAAIWIYRQYADRTKFDRDNELANWMLLNSNNAYVPFGDNRGNSKSVSELREWHLEKNRVWVESQKNILLGQCIKIARIETSKRINHMALEIHRAKVVARNNFIKIIKSLPTNQILHQIAIDCDHHIQFYPAEIIPETIDLSDELTKWAYETIKTKCKSVKRGPWKEWLKKQS